MRNNKNTLTRLLAFLAAAAIPLALSGCKHKCPDCEFDDDDIVYSWKIPTSQADCDSMGGDLVYRSEATADDGSLDGGASIVDRDGGASIVDRDGNPVKQHCYRECADGETPQGKTIVDWHNTGEFIVGYQRCTT